MTRGARGALSRSDGSNGMRYMSDIRYTRTVRPFPCTHRRWVRVLRRTEHAAYGDLPVAGVHRPGPAAGGGRYPGWRGGRWGAGYWRRSCDGNAAQALRDYVAMQVVSGEAGQARAEVGCLRAVRRPVAADQVAGEHAASGDADAEFAGGRDDGAFDAPRDQRVFDPHVGDRVDRRGQAQCVRVNLG